MTAKMLDFDAIVPALTRRGFVKAGGALIVSLQFADALRAMAPGPRGSSLDATRVTAWLEIHPDNTVLVRSGKADMGTGTTGQFIQVVAEELNVRPESITVLLGDTDGTPDGGFAAGSLWGSHNLRKVSAFTYQALLALASKQLGVPVSSLTGVNGVISGGGRSISYADLVKGQQLDLTLTITGVLPVFEPGRNALSSTYGLLVTGDLPPGVSEPWPPQHPLPRVPNKDVLGPWGTPRPPMKAMRDYTVIGQPFPSPAIRDKVSAKTEWVGDVRLPGMLHARTVRPAAVGATLVLAGTFDRSKFPTAEVVTKKNLVAVLSPDEWEAIAAAREVAATTKWTTWAGLPGSENMTSVIRAVPRSKASGARGDTETVRNRLATAAKTLSASFGGPCVRHAPIAGYCAVADVRGDGQVIVWSHSGQPQAHRAYIAHMLGVPLDRVIVRWREGAAQFGRATMGGDGAEADAVILSQLVGKPVRVQWTLSEDLAWSALSPAWEADVKASLDANGTCTGMDMEFCGPASGDPRMVGAILGGLPTVVPSSAVGVTTPTVWLYDRIPLVERMFGMPNIGTDAASPGLRGGIMRSPGHRQPAFALESMLNEAAAAAGADAVEFRIRHTTDKRLIELLTMTAEAAGWESRRSPHPAARRTGSDVLKGRGVGVVMRANGYWVSIAEIEVVPGTGKITVPRFTIGVDVGRVINPRQLERMARGGVTFGLSEALKEEVTFDRSRVTSTDWTRYKILTMEETPDIKVVFRSHDDRGFGAGGEAANASPTQAVAAAFFDATGVNARRLPLTPQYVKALLNA